MSDQTMHTKGVQNDNTVRDKEEERKVKQLNQEIMFAFEKHAAPFRHASASLLSVLYFISERYGKSHQRIER